MHGEIAPQGLKNGPLPQRSRCCGGEVEQQALSSIGNNGLPRGQRQSHGGFVPFQDGRFLTKARFIDHIREVLGKAGLSPRDYAGHSFRIGAATTARACGLNDSTIQMLGRWSSSAYLAYIKTSRKQLANQSAVLGHLLK